LNTFKAEPLLRTSVRQFTQCAAVRRVHVVWAESVTPPDLSADTCCGTEVTFALPLVTHNDSSLNVRFLPVPGKGCTGGGWSGRGAPPSVSR